MISILISYPHIIALVIWTIIALVAVLRYFNISIFVRVSWGWLIVLTIVLHFAYAGLLSWGQYYVWSASSNEFGQTLLSAPLAKEAPIPALLEWVRPHLEQPLGYFTFYVFTKFFLRMIILFGLTGLFVIFLKIRARYRPMNFAENDIASIALAVLLSGWPGVIVLIPLGFLCAIIFSLGARIFYGTERIYLPPAFLLAAPFALAFGGIVLTYFNLYSLLKL